MKRPAAPVVNADTWRSLLVAAGDFGKLAPWTWMHDSELIGLRHPITGEMLLCSILGRLQSVFALLVFRRDAGRRWILNTILDDADGPSDPDNGLDQDCLKAEFVRKSELEPEDRAVLTAGAFVPAVKRGCAWPVFRSMVPGGYPWFLTQEEAETLLFALPRAAAFARLCQEAEGLGVDLAEGQVPFLPGHFDPAARALRSEDLDWQPAIAPPDPLVIEVRVPEAVVDELLALPSTKGPVLELDIFYSSIPVVDGDRPRFPKAVAAVERASGFIGGFQLAKASDPDACSTCAEVLARALRQLGLRPQEIRVRRQRVARMIAPVAERLAIAVRMDDTLAALDQAREEVERRFRG